MPGPFAIQDSSGLRTLDFLDSAPASDTGQVALPVRVISQLGAGTGGGTSSGGLTDTELRASPVPVSIASGGSPAGLTDAELRASPVPVSGFPTTQPVSGTVAVSNLPATQPVSGSIGISNWPAAQPVTGAFWQGTQPVSGTLGINNFPASQPVTGIFWPATQPISLQAADKAVSATGVAAAAVTATLPAVSGQFHYITRINIIAYASAARTGASTPVVVTSTNLPGSLAWTTPTAAAIGTQYETDIQLSGPLKSAATGVATTIVAPATTSVIWRINVVYYTGT